jgi:hypothetical protein
MTTRRVHLTAPVVGFLTTCAVLEERQRPGTAGDLLRRAIERGRWDRHGGMTVTLPDPAVVLLGIHAVSMRDSVADPRPALDLLAVLDG